jgi:hypothetical protein
MLPKLASFYLMPSSFYVLELGLRNLGFVDENLMYEILYIVVSIFGWILMD